MRPKDHSDFFPFHRKTQGTLETQAHELAGKRALVSLRVSGDCHVRTRAEGKRSCHSAFLPDGNKDIRPEALKLDTSFKHQNWDGGAGFTMIMTSKIRVSEYSQWDLTHGEVWRQLIPDLGLLL